MTENLSKILPYILSATAAGLAGGVIASFWNPRVKMRSAIQHFAAGAVLAAVASNVVPRVEKIGNLTGIVIGFGGQHTPLKALIAGVLPQGKGNVAFGLFYKDTVPTGCLEISHPAYSMTTPASFWSSFRSLHNLPRCLCSSLRKR